MEYELIDKLPENISQEILANAKASNKAVICRTPREHPSECTYLVIIPSGSRIAKFKYASHAIAFAHLCLDEAAENE